MKVKRTDPKMKADKRIWCDLPFHYGQ